MLSYTGHVKAALFAGLFALAVLAGCRENSVSKVSDPEGTFEGDEGTIVLTPQGDFTLSPSVTSVFGKKTVTLGEGITDADSKGTWRMDGDTLHLMPTTWNGEPITKALEAIDMLNSTFHKKPEEIEKMKKAAQDIRGSMSSDRKTIFLPVPHGTAMFLKQ